MEIRPVGAELFKPDAHKDRYEVAHSRFSEFCESIQKWCCPGWRRRYSDTLRAGRSWDRIPVGEGFPHSFSLRPTKPPIQCISGHSRE
jgi:hypothetical protein